MDPREYEQMFALEEDHWWYRALRRRILQALRACPPPAAGGAAPLRVLDAGCGTGMNLQAIAAWAAAGAVGTDGAHTLQFYGLDASRQAVALAARRGLDALAQASVEAIPWRDGSLDLILSADVLYHRGVRDDEAALREMARCLRPGGVLVLNLPAFSWLRSAHDVAIHTARRYTRGQIREKLKRTGFDPVCIFYWNWLLFPPLAAVRLARAALAHLRRPAPGAQAPRAPRSDLATMPAALNRLLDALLRCEAALGRSAAPAGLSVMAAARRTAPPARGDSKWGADS